MYQNITIPTIVPVQNVLKTGKAAMHTLTLRQGIDGQGASGTASLF